MLDLPQALAGACSCTFPLRLSALKWQKIQKLFACTCRAESAPTAQVSAYWGAWMGGISARAPACGSLRWSSVRACGVPRSAHARCVRLPRRQLSATITVSAGLDDGCVCAAHSMTT